MNSNIDRISQLSDPLLCHILSFLPTNLAARTSILATRWRFLWLFVSNIDIDESELQYLWAHESNRFNELWPKYKDLVERVLVGGIWSPPLQKLRLRFGTDETLNDFLDTWVVAAIKRNVRELELTHLFDDDIDYPHEIFTCKTLVSLKISRVSFEDLGSVWLPCLKILKIEDLNNGHEETLPKLFSGCPVLEELDIFRFVLGVPRNLIISVPTLKYLRLDNYDEGFDCESDEPEDQWGKLVLNAPRLQYLELKDSLSKKFVFENISCLSKACVRVAHTELTNPSPPVRIYQLLSQLSHVKILNVNSCISDCTLPIFHCLTQLKIGGFEESWNLSLLGNFLHHSPKLETLTIERDRAAWLMRPNDPLVDNVAENLLDRLEDCKKSFPSALCLGGSLEAIRRLLRGRGAIEKLIMMDMSYDMVKACKDAELVNDNVETSFVVGDEEFLPVKESSLDLVISCLGLHWTNDLPGAMIQCRMALKPDGLFLAAIMGGETLKELRIACTVAQIEREGGISPRLSPLAQVRDAGNLLTRAGFSLPGVDVDEYTVRYRSALELIEHLRAMGETNALMQRNIVLNKETALATAAVYESMFAAEDGTIPATFQVIYMTGWREHHSHQKAKSRGSATVSFNDIQKQFGPGG